MLNGRRTLFLGGGVAVLLLVAALLLSWALSHRGAPPVEPTANAVHAAAQRPLLEGADTSPAALQPARAALWPEPVAVAELDPPPTIAPERLTGTVYGLVHDPAVGPLAEHHIGFSAGTNPRSRKYRFRSDEVGEYRTSPLPVGEYQVLYYGRRPEWPRPAARFVGKVTVEADQSVLHDVEVLGQITLAGTFKADSELLGDAEGLSMRLELWTRWEPEELVANGTAVTSKFSDSGRPPEGLTPEELRALRKEDTPPLDRSGQFRFPALEPGSYTLKIFCVELGDGRECYIERVVDLSAGDVTLEPEEFSILDFVQATLARSERDG